MSAALHRAPGGREFSISRSKPGRIGGSRSDVFILCPCQYRSDTTLRLQGFDLELRVITQHDDGMLSHDQSRLRPLP